MRQFAARVCLAAGLGMYFPALPSFAEVLVLTHVAPGHTAVAAVSLREANPAKAQAAAPDAPEEDASTPSERLMLVVGLTLLGLVTLWRS